MGEPTLNAWEICFVGWMACLGIPIQGASPSVLLHRAVRRPLAVRTELNRFPSIVIRYLHLNKIGCKKRTQGTETSKYLQERTSTETPQVVASERGPGQWHQGIKRNALESAAIVGDSPVRVEHLMS